MDDNNHQAQYLDPHLQQLSVDTCDLTVTNYSVTDYNTSITFLYTPVREPAILLNTDTQYGYLFFCCVFNFCSVQNVLCNARTEFYVTGFKIQNTERHGRLGLVIPLKPVDTGCL